METFRPKESIKELMPTSGLKKFNGVYATIPKVRALSSLLAWAALDQDKPKRKPSPPTKRVIKTKNAKRAGINAVATILDRGIQAGLPKHIAEEIFVEMTIGKQGFSKRSSGRSGPALSKAFQKVEGELSYVHQIVKYLIRCHVYPTSQNRNRIVDAEEFVEKARQRSPYFGNSKISQIWLHYRFAAPYIFALYEEPTFNSANKKWEESVNWMERLATDKKRILEFLGRAAFASDIVKQRTSDFKKVPRVQPAVHPFSDTESALMPTRIRNRVIK